MEKVVPLVGTWIEISVKVKGYQRKGVVPLVGTWIEIRLSDPPIPALQSYHSGHIA